MKAKGNRWLSRVMTRPQQMDKLLATILILKSRIPRLAQITANNKRRKSIKRSRKKKTTLISFNSTQASSWAASMMREVWTIVQTRWMTASKSQSFLTMKIWVWTSTPLSWARVKTPFSKILMISARKSIITFRTVSTTSKGKKFNSL